MSFLMPKAPKVVSTPAATPAVQADNTDTPVPGEGGKFGDASLISTGSQGLTKKASTVKPSLLGGGGSAN